MRRYLKKNVGRSVLVQAQGLAYRGRLHAVGGDGLVLVEVQLLVESPVSSDWRPFDGAAVVPAGVVQHVQVM